MFRLSALALEFEIPAMLGDLLFPELSKGAGHKYIRRLPTGNPKRPWRYIYNVAGGKGEARRNALGNWNDQHVFEAQRSDVVQAASREMYDAQRAMTAVRDRVTRQVSEVHDGTEHPSMAQPYPKGEERSRINAAFERFVTAIRETGAIHKAFQYLDGMDALRVRISRIQETA